MRHVRLAYGCLIKVAESGEGHGADGMPYIEGAVQHTGIETLPEYRGKGCAKCTAALAAHNLIRRGVCHQWECNAENIASVAPAESIGYKKFAAAYILEER